MYRDLLTIVMSNLIEYEMIIFTITFYNHAVCALTEDIQCTEFDFSDISKVQDDEVGDGTTSVVVLASELLRVSN